MQLGNFIDVLLDRHVSGRARLKRDGTRAETRIGLSAKRTSPFKSAEESVHSITGSRGVRISNSNGSNAGYTMFWGTRMFLLHFPYRASPCAIRFQRISKYAHLQEN